MNNALLLLPSYGGVLIQHLLSLNKVTCEAVHLSGAPIDQARCFMIEHALVHTDKDVFVFIDSDISFEPEDLQKLIDKCEETKAIVSGIYVLKNGTNKIVATTDPKVQTTREDGLLPANWVGMGFCAIHRRALEQMGALEERVQLPRPNGLTEVWPFFIPMIVGGVYFGEDYAFCVKAQNAGIPIFLDSTILVTHWGLQGYKLQK